jgi:hypothetical protein
MRPGTRRILWFVALWAGGIIVLAAVAIPLHWLLRAIYSKPQVSSDRHSRSVGRRLRHLER